MDIVQELIKKKEGKNFKYESAWVGTKLQFV